MINFLILNEYLFEQLYRSKSNQDALRKQIENACLFTLLPSGLLLAISS